MGSSQPIPLGTLSPWSGAGSYNTIVYVVQQLLGKMQTATLVQVQACTNDGGVAPFGFVDVLPLVSQVDGAGNAVPHLTVHGLPYLRLQGGASAVILDPSPGDLGIAVFANRDLSIVKATQGQAPPASSRQFDFADGLYLGGVLNGQPTQYLQFNSSGINLMVPNGATIEAGASAVPVCSQPLVTWINSMLRPALASAGITVTAPPADALTTTFEAS